MDRPNRERTEEVRRLYETYGRPFEAEHWGEFVAASSDGRTLLAPTLAEAAFAASEAFGQGNCIFKVGEAVVARSSGRGACHDGR